MKKFLFTHVGLLWCTFLFSQTANSYINKGNEYYKQLQFDLAESQYRRALEEAPQNSAAQFNLANALYRQKKYDEAKGILNGLAEKDKTLQASAYYNAGVVYSREKDIIASIDAYKKALRINPSDTQARENLQKALSELKQQQNKKNQKQNSKLSQKQAEQKLKQLEEKEKQLQQRLQGQSGKGGRSMAQDW